MKDACAIWKHLLLVILTGFASFASADDSTKPRVTLLISVHDPSPRALQRRFHGPLFQQLARKFDDQFRSRFQTRTIYLADQADLWRELHDPENAGVFWVSHAGTNPMDTNASSSTVILDSKGVNVAPLFLSARYSKNLQFLGLIGCKAQGLFQSLQARPDWKSTSPDLTIDSFPRKVELITEYQGVLNRFDQTWRPLPQVTQVIQDPAAKPTVRFRVKRTLPSSVAPESLTSLRIERKGDVLAVFPPALSGMTQEVEFEVEKHLVRKISDLTLVANTGIQSLAPTAAIPALGVLEIESEDPGLQWLRVELDGKPLGVTQNVYRARMK